MPKLVALLGALATTVMAGSGRNGHSHFKKDNCEQCCEAEEMMSKYQELLLGRGMDPQLGNMWIQAVNQNCNNVDLPLFPLKPVT